MQHYNQRTGCLPDPIGEYHQLGAVGRPDFQFRSRSNVVVLAFGSNRLSSFGSPEKTFDMALSWLAERGLRDTYMTARWHSSPFLSAGLEIYSNSVVVARTDLSPFSLLRLAKQFEGLAGRRLNPHRWSGRPMDIDIISMGALTIGWPNPAAQSQRLIIPHPRAHVRDFVMRPLASIWPDWRHPVLELTAQQLAHSLPKRHGAAIQVASCQDLCQKLP